jgi:hypothetical protein
VNTPDSNDTLTNVLRVAGLSFVAWLVWNTSDAVFGRVFNGTNKPAPRRR